MVSARICFFGNRMYYDHYRPIIKIRNDDMCNSCELIFKNKERVYSGEEIEVYMIFLVEDLVADYLTEGQVFTMYEGLKIVGQGKVTST